MRAAASASPPVGHARDSVGQLSLGWIGARIGVQARRRSCAVRVRRCALAAPSGRNAPRAALRCLLPCFHHTRRCCCCRCGASRPHSACAARLGAVLAASAAASASAVRAAPAPISRRRLALLPLLPTTCHVLPLPRSLTRRSLHALLRIVSLPPLCLRRSHARGPRLVVRGCLAQRLAHARQHRRRRLARRPRLVLRPLPRAPRPGPVCAAQGAAAAPSGRRWCAQQEQRRPRAPHLGCAPRAVRGRGTAQQRAGSSRRAP